MKIFNAFWSNLSTATDSGVKSFEVNTQQNWIQGLIYRDERPDGA